MASKVGCSWETFLRSYYPVDEGIRIVNAPLTFERMLQLIFLFWGAYRRVVVVNKTFFENMKLNPGVHICLTFLI